MQMALDALESLQAWPETPENFKRFRAIEALRTALAQPEKEWVGLTDDGIRKLAHTYLKGTGDSCIIDFARAIESSHGIK
jgi:hypothetical protein